MNQLDFYVILGIERAATATEVKRAYQRLARRYHPDINPGDDEAEAFFRLVSEAYETLMDPDRRHRYDRDGLRSASPNPSSVEFQGFDFSSGSGGSAGSATFVELFSDVFTHAANRRGASAEQRQRGSDLFGEVRLTFEEAISGVERKLRINRLAACESCGGSGRRKALESRCGYCMGVGTTRWRRGHMVFSKSCQFCGGTGQRQDQPCLTCHESGIGSLDEDITIQVPAGVKDGARLRIESKGNAGRFGGEPGDLYITTNVGKHRFFTRDGDNLRLALPIAIYEAALGAEIKVPTFNGVASLLIPAGTQSGQRFYLKSYGVASPRTGERGDLIVSVNVVLPPIADERSKELLREFGKINSGNVRKDLFKE